MRNNSINVFMHPSATVFLDDNENFLKIVCMGLQDKIKLHTFTDSKAMFNAVNQCHDKYKVMVPRLQNDTDIIGEISSKLNISEIYKLAHDPHRFDYISVLVFDQVMPNKSGLELFREMQNSNLGKVLLTAETDKDLAIQAFNEGLIDKYIMKEGDDLEGRLQSAIIELQQRHFYRLAEPLLASLSKTLLDMLSNPRFITLFQALINEYQIKEYYLADSSGTFLLLDSSGEPMWLIIRSDADIEEQVHMLRAVNAPNTILEPVELKSDLLFLLDEIDYKKPATQWQQYLFNAHPLSEQYYYAIAKGPISAAFESK